MKEKILAFLRTKLTGASNAFLEGASSQLATTITEESQIETVCNAGLIASLQFSSQFAQQEGDRRATTATQTAVQSYEQKFGLKDGKPIGNPDPNQAPPAAGSPEAIEKLIQDGIKAHVDPLKQELEGYRQKEQQATLRESAIAKIKDKFKDSTIPIPDVYYNTLNVAKAEDVDAEVTRLSGEIEKYQQSLVDSKLITAPLAGSGGANASQVKDDIQKWANDTNPKS